MINEIIAIIFSLLFPIFIGYTVVLFLFKSRPFSLLGTLAISFALGMGIITQWMLGLILLRQSLNFININLPLAIMAFIFIFLNQRNKIQANLKSKINPLPSAENFLNTAICLILAGYIGYEMFYVFSQAFIIPIHAWDSIYVIAVKAKVFFFDGNVDKLKDLPLASYPLQVPFSLTWLAYNFGVWDDQIINIIFPLMFVSYLAIQYEFSKIYMNPLWALIGVALVVSCNFTILHAAIAYRDLFLMCYTATTLMLLLIGFKRGNDQYFILAGFFAGIALFTKLEALGYFFIDVIILIILLNKKKITFVNQFKKILKFISPGIVIYSLHNLFNFMHALPAAEGRLHLSLQAENFLRIKPVLRTFTESLFLTGNWNILWFLLIVSIVTQRQKLRISFEAQILTIAITLFLGLYVAINLLTPNFHSLSGDDYPTVLSRVFLHFSPLIPLLIVFLNKPENDLINLKDKHA